MSHDSCIVVGLIRLICTTSDHEWSDRIREKPRLNEVLDAPDKNAMLMSISRISED